MTNLLLPYLRKKLRNLRRLVKDRRRDEIVKTSNMKNGRLKMFKKGSKLTSQILSPTRLGCKNLDAL